LLKKWGHDRSHIFPFNVNCSEIPERFKQNKVYGRALLEIPSFMLVQRALVKGLQNRGIESVMNPESMDYDY
jgi:RNA-directed DNA polymerase